jgi:hypothetical protein
MAKSSYKTHESKSVTKVTTPSHYGSHSSMVVADLGDEVTCKDDRGEYTTLKTSLDNGLSDPKRNAAWRF